MKKVLKWLDKVIQALYTSFTTGDFNHNPFASAMHLQNHRTIHDNQK